MRVACEFSISQNDFLPFAQCPPFSSHSTTALLDAPFLPSCGPVTQLDPVPVFDFSLFKRTWSHWLLSWHLMIKGSFPAPHQPTLRPGSGDFTSQGEPDPPSPRLCREGVGAVRICSRKTWSSKCAANQSGFAQEAFKGIASNFKICSFWRPASPPQPAVGVSAANGIRMEHRPAHFSLWSSHHM